MTKTELNEVRDKAIREGRLMRFWDRMYQQRKRENASTYLLDEAYRNYLWSEGGFQVLVLMIAHFEKRISAEVQSEILHQLDIEEKKEEK